MPHPFIYSLSGHHAESPWNNCWGWTGGMCDAQDIAVLFPKFSESSDEAHSWNSVMHMGIAVASYWPELMIMKPPETGLDSPSELCSCLTQLQCSAIITRLWNMSERQFVLTQGAVVFLFPENLSNRGYMELWAALKALTPELLSENLLRGLGSSGTHL